jgi:[acyl-carrier-protein] S-malonyltransferase
MKFAFVFPGQGSQSVGMMKGYSDLPIVKETFSEASDILHKDFWAMVNNGPPDSINLTTNTQPLMLMSGIADYRAWKSLGGPDPAFIAGHSLGEYTALVVSGVMTYKDALSMVRFRGEVMQQAVPEGTGKMAAILGLDDDVIQKICSEVTRDSKVESLEPANFNSPGQVVIAGHKNAVLRGIELAKKKGAKMAVLLPMSVPSHCSLMAPAAEKMQQQLEMITLQTPSIPVIHNADVKQHKNSTDIRNILVKQLCIPVRWTETINSFTTEDVTHIAECGPGKILTGLNKRINKNLQNIALTDTNALRQTISILV